MGSWVSSITSLDSLLVSAVVVALLSSFWLAVLESTEDIKVVAVVTFGIVIVIISTSSSLLSFLFSSFLFSVSATLLLSDTLSSALDFSLLTSLLDSSAFGLLALSCWVLSSLVASSLSFDSLLSPLFRELYNSSSKATILFTSYKSNVTFFSLLFGSWVSSISLWSRFINFLSLIWIYIWSICLTLGWNIYIL